ETGTVPARSIRLAPFAGGSTSSRRVARRDRTHYETRKHAWNSSMKIGVLLFPVPGGSAQLARIVEDLGFDSLVFADTQNLAPEVWGQLMLAARDTHRIELGTGVTNPGTRDAAVTASAALALQVECGGRE